MSRPHGVHLCDEGASVLAPRFRLGPNVGRRRCLLGRLLAGGRGAGGLSDLEPRGPEHGGGRLGPGPGHSGQGPAGSLGAARHRRAHRSARSAGRHEWREHRDRWPGGCDEYPPAGHSARGHHRARPPGPGAVLLSPRAPGLAGRGGPDRVTARRTGPPRRRAGPAGPTLLDQPHGGRGTRAGPSDTAGTSSAAGCWSCSPSS